MLFFTHHYSPQKKAEITENGFIQNDKISITYLIEGTGLLRLKLHFFIQYL